LETGINAGKQAKTALQAKFRCYCVDFNGLFLVAYIDLAYNDFCVYFKTLVAHNESCKRLYYKNDQFPSLFCVENMTM
jgi:hypothetical protein